MAADRIIDYQTTATGLSSTTYISQLTGSVFSFGTGAVHVTMPPSGGGGGSTRPSGGFLYPRGQG